ncbi:hypothetical protein LA345_13375 [Burkholderia vietnamiensis]|nr:hypothetical protein [Burkholderia vietnamiensis]
MATFIRALFVVAACGALASLSGCGTTPMSSGSPFSASTGSSSAASSLSALSTTRELVAGATEAQGGDRATASFAVPGEGGNAGNALGLGTALASATASSTLGLGPLTPASPWIDGRALYEHPELLAACAPSPESALRLASSASAQNPLARLVAWLTTTLGGSERGLGDMDLESASPGAGFDGSGRQSPVVADMIGPVPTSGPTSAASAGATSSDALSVGDAYARAYSLNAAPFSFDTASSGGPIDALADFGASAPTDAMAEDQDVGGARGRSGRSPSGAPGLSSHATRTASTRPRTLLDDPRVRAATFWDVGGGLHPQMEQAGRALFLDPHAAWPAPTEFAGSEAARMAQLQRAVALHAKRKPKGWDVLVDAVRQAREENGEAAALRLALALTNQVPYVDGTDGTFYPPYRFFTEAHVVCKDFAVANYLLLLDSGYPPEKLRILALTPRYAAAPEWHIMTVALADGYAEPFALSSNPPPGGRNAAPASWNGPSPILRKIMAGEEPAAEVFKGPHGPALAPLSASDEAHRPVAEAFTEHGFVSFELTSTRTADGSWSSIAGGDYPRWKVRGGAGAGTASPFAAVDPSTRRGAPARRAARGRGDAPDAAAVPDA